MARGFLPIGAYGTIKDMPSMWTLGQASGTAAALCIKHKTTPRRLDVEMLRGQLLAQRALYSVEEAHNLSQAKLPSVKSIKEFYEGNLAPQRQYSEARVEL